MGKHDFACPIQQSNGEDLLGIDLATGRTSRRDLDKTQDAVSVVEEQHVEILVQVDGVTPVPKEQFIAVRALGNLRALGGLDGVPVAYFNFGDV